MEDTIKTVFAKMSSVGKPQQKFMMTLLSVLMVFRGKATYLNMARFSTSSEKRYRRWSHRYFDFIQFNTTLFASEFQENRECVAATNASFISKSGKKTDGPGWFYNGSAGESQRGLEVSTISVTDLKTNTAYAIDSQQTIDEEGKSRVEQYVSHALKVLPKLLNLGIKYLAADAFYSKKAFVNPVLQEGMHIVGKLRIDANLQWLYEGEYNGQGCPKRFDGKVDLEDLCRFDFARIFDAQVKVYTKVVHAKFLKRAIRVVLLKPIDDDKKGSALLYSTDTNLDAVKLVSYYKSRFQIEFLFRDAKQYTGLTHCQSVRKEAINLHVNASLTALNLLKFEDRRETQTDAPTVISIASWKRRKFNQYLMNRVFSSLGLDRSCEKFSYIYDRYSDYGAIAA
ncbi:transposase [Microbulbifer sp. SSSA002]|uniref:transposase n=1 Tax=Microbulbifer sp. SSSA002 TaxID=3243376 RepID=UPI0040396C3B